MLSHKQLPEIRYLTFSDNFHAQAFRPGVVDLPAGASEAPTSAINVQNFGEFEMDIYPIASRETFSLDSLPLMDKWMPALTQTQARYRFSCQIQVKHWECFEAHNA